MTRRIYFDVEIPDEAEVDEEGVAETIAVMLREDYDIDHNGVGWREVEWPNEELERILGA